jgi:Fe-S cluster biogenesis protein NfuA
VLIEEKIEQYIEYKILPLVQADGGEIKLESVKDDEVTLILMGECSRCNITRTCFKSWLLNDLSKQFGEQVKLKFIIKKPYFWDK